MSQENVEIVRSAYAAGHALTEMARHIAPNAEFDFSDVWPDEPIIRGLEAMRAFNDTGPWGGSMRFDVQRLVDVDDQRVLALVQAQAVGHVSGAPVAAPAAHLFTIRDGFMVRMKVYRDHQEALKAVGLAE
jgi:ketosteroid isomerase-like protein